MASGQPPKQPLSRVCHSKPCIFKSASEDGSGSATDRKNLDRQETAVVASTTRELQLTIDAASNGVFAIVPVCAIPVLVSIAGRIGAPRLIDALSLGRSAAVGMVLCEGCFDRLTDLETTIWDWFRLKSTGQRRN
jgi:hypothetical protein